MGVFDQVREAMKMRAESKRIEAEIKKITAEYANGGITVIAKGDMSIEKIAITPEAYEEVLKGKPARFETMLFNVVNGALKRAREAVQAEMMKMMQAGGGLGGLFGKIDLELMTQILGHRLGDKGIGDGFFCLIFV